MLNGLLKRWHATFNPETKKFHFRHIWIILPGLHLLFWNPKSCEAIGNELGHFLFVEDANLKARNKIDYRTYKSKLHSLRT